MKTKEIPAIVMLVAGGVYCLLGIYCQIPLMDFFVQLLIILLAFWMLGGIIRMVLNYFIGELEDKAKEEEDEEAEEKGVEGESEASEDGEGTSEDAQEETDI